MPIVLALAVFFASLQWSQWVYGVHKMESWKGARLQARVAQAGVQFLHALAITAGLTQVDTPASQVLDALQRRRGRAGNQDLR